MLLWTEGYNYLSEIAISCPLEKHAEVGLQDYIIVLFLISQGIFMLFPIVAAHIYIPITNVQVFSFLYIPTSTCFLLSFWLQTSVKWYFIVLLTYVSLLISKVENVLLSLPSCFLLSLFLFPKIFWYFYIHQ